MEYTDVSAFAAGAIGEPGQRTFLLQFIGPWGRHTYLLEKGQVAALADGANRLLTQIVGGAEPTAPEELLDEVPRFRIGQLELGYDGEGEAALVVLHSVAAGDEPTTYRLTMELLVTGARQGDAAVAGGRPSCPNCGLAMDPEGHVCPTTNGDLRHHQP